MLKYTCNGPKVFQEQDYVGRTDCGYDLTHLIGAIPADGKDYKVECPKCLNVGVHMRTPERSATQDA